ncbi:MAG: hypothetical protein DMF93_08190, partial [Acidobacteria bacterium]
MDHGIVGREGGQFPLHGVDTILEIADFVARRREHEAQPRRHARILVGEQAADLGQDRPRAPRDRDALFQQQPTHRIEARRARRHPLRAQAMERQDLLLGHRFHRDVRNVATPQGLEQCLGIGPIGLVASHIRPDVLTRQQRDAMAGCLRGSRPIMRRAA